MLNCIAICRSIDKKLYDNILDNGFSQISYFTKKEDDNINEFMIKHSENSIVNTLDSPYISSIREMQSPNVKLMFKDNLSGNILAPLSGN